MKGSNGSKAGPRGADQRPRKPTVGAGPNANSRAELFEHGRATMAPMRQAEYWEWWLPDERTGKLRRSGYRTTDVTAHATHPDAKRVEGSRELRVVPETDAEPGSNSTSAWKRRT